MIPIKPEEACAEFGSPVVRNKVFRSAPYESEGRWTKLVKLVRMPTNETTGDDRCGVPCHRENNSGKEERNKVFVVFTEHVVYWENLKWPAFEVL